MKALTDITVLLFFQDFERDKFFRNDRYLQRVARPLYRRISRRQKVTGFYVWFHLLATALRREGYDVRVNDFKAARANPAFPVGLVGYPCLLDGWKLPNPAVLGPALFDHPQQAPTLMDDPRFCYYLVTCDWMREMFRPAYGSRCAQWYAGIDLDEWPDTRSCDKSWDVLIYDKIRWHHDEYESRLLNPIISDVQRRGLKATVVRYRHYDHATYRELLRSSRAMIFLCEHETQGMAYQEALASNVPILAWENGYWLDPRRPEYEAERVPATSVPYFSSECGERFQDLDAFYPAFDQFWNRLGSYEPRAYVARELSMSGSAASYMSYYSTLLPAASASSGAQLSS